MSDRDLTLISLLIHIPVVTAWVGLVLFDVFSTMAPGIAENQRARLVASTRWITLGLLIAIAVTGVWQTMDNPFVKVNSISELEELRERTTYGKSLFVKHIFVFGTVGLSLINRFYLARREQAGLQLASGPGSGAAATSGLTLLKVAVVANAAFALGVLLATARMTIELH